MASCHVDGTDNIRMMMEAREFWEDRSHVMVLSKVAMAKCTCRPTCTFPIERIVVTCYSTK